MHRLTKYKAAKELRLRFFQIFFANSYQSLKHVSAFKQQTIYKNGWLHLVVRKIRYGRVTQTKYMTEQIKSGQKAVLSASITMGKRGNSSAWSQLPLLPLLMYDGSAPSN